jgi:hypothetical protein
MKNITRLTEILPKGEKFTLIIGSGLNKHALNNNKTILSDWGKLLDCIFPNKKKNIFDDYILEFEQRLVEETSRQKKKSAKEIELLHLKRLKGCIKDKQTQFLAKRKNIYPIYLFNNDIVDNVISLNFDLIPELLLRKNKSNKVSNFDIAKTGCNSYRHRTINEIKFWHPHGDIDNIRSLILGLRHYAQHLKDVEKMRVIYKVKERTDKKVYPINTWYEALLHNPILILGASLSYSEWDIWTALVNRERNFAREKNNNKHRNSVFIMKSDCQNKNSYTSSWIKPLFDTNYCYDKQWELLEKLFTNDYRKGS